MRFINSFQFVLLVLIFLLSGCSEQKASVIRIGISPWPAYNPFVLALEYHLYDQTQVRIIRFATPSESLKALHDGMVDAVAITTDEALSYAGKDKLKMVLVLDVSNGGDAVVAKPHIKTLNDLKGKRLGVEPTGMGEFMSKRIFDFASDTSFKDVILVPMEIERQEHAYRATSIDAFITYDPAKTKLIKAGGHVIFDSTQIPNEIVDVLVTKEESLKSKKKELSCVVKGWFRALDHIHKYPKESFNKMGRYEGLSAEEFETAYKEVLIPSLSENFKMLNTKNGILNNSLRHMSVLIRPKEPQSGPNDVSKMIDDQLLPKE